MKHEDTCKAERRPRLPLVALPLTGTMVSVMDADSQSVLARWASRRLRKYQRSHACAGSRRPHGKSASYPNDICCMQMLNLMELPMVLRPLAKTWMVRLFCGNGTRAACSLYAVSRLSRPSIDFLSRLASFGTQFSCKHRPLEQNKDVSVQSTSKISCLYVRVCDHQV